jgi:hypothetical protein
MGYVIAALVVLVIVGAGVAFMVISATRKQRQASIVAPDEQTPLGDTDQHAGEQTEEGRTVRQPESGQPESGMSRGGSAGGEGEGSRPVTPESERLANRPR